MILAPERSVKIRTQLKSLIATLTPTSLDFLVPGQIVNVRKPQTGELVMMRVQVFPENQRRFQGRAPRFAFIEVPASPGHRVRRLTGPVHLGCIAGHGDSVLLQNVLADALVSGDYLIH